MMRHGGPEASVTSGISTSTTVPASSQGSTPEPSESGTTVGADPDQETVDGVAAHQRDDGKREFELRSYDVAHCWTWKKQIPCFEMFKKKRRYWLLW